MGNTARSRSPLFFSIPFFLPSPGFYVVVVACGFGPAQPRCHLVNQQCLCLHPWPNASFLGLPRTMQRASASPPPHAARRTLRLRVGRERGQDGCRLRLLVPRLANTGIPREPHSFPPSTYPRRSALLSPLPLSSAFVYSFSTPPPPPPPPPRRFSFPAKAEYIPPTHHPVHPSTTMCRPRKEPPKYTHFSLL